MANKIINKANNIVFPKWRLSLKEISPIETCADMWREIQYTSPASSTIKIKSLLSIGVERGERNTRAFEIARSMRDAGYSESEALSEIDKWNQLNTPPLSKLAEMGAIVRSTFRHRPHSTSFKQSTSLLGLIRHEIASLHLNPNEHTAAITALALTNTKENVWQVYHIQPGDLIFSLQSLANRAGVKKSQVRSMLAKAQKAGIVTTQVLGDRAATRLTWQGEFATIFRDLEAETLEDQSGRASLINQQTDSAKK